MVRRVALLTAGGFAPCLSSAVGGLIERYTEVAPDVEIIAYQHGYHGLLTGNSMVVDDEARRRASILHRFGGSPIGNSRVKLTNAANLVERGLVQEGEDPSRSRRRGSGPTASTSSTPSAVTTPTPLPRTSRSTSRRTVTT